METIIGNFRVDGAFQSRLFKVLLLVLLTAVLSSMEARAQIPAPDRGKFYGRILQPFKVANLFEGDYITPEVQGIVGPKIIRQGESAAFNIVANIEKATLPLRCQWNFGDGTTTFGLAGVHTYSKPGKYRILCTLANQYGEDSAALDVLVVPANRQGNADVANHNSAEKTRGKKGKWAM